MIAPIFICLFPLLPFSSFLFTAELEQNFQVQGCRKAAAQTTTTTVATHPAPDSRGRGKWGLEAHKTRRQLCLPFFAATHSKWLPKREQEREKTRERTREREDCVGRHFVRVCAQRFLHTVAISFWPWARTISTRKIYWPAPEEAPREGAGQGVSGLCLWLGIAFLLSPSFTISFFEYPKKHTEPTRRLPPPSCAAPRGALSGLGPFRKGSRCPQSVYMSVRVHACVCLCVRVCVSWSNFTEAAAAVVVVVVVVIRVNRRLLLMVAEGTGTGGDSGNILSGFNKRVSVLFMCYVHAQAWKTNNCIWSGKNRF